jgi:hypothetical protein
MITNLSNAFIQEKPFPPQQELVNRLDISMQWDEFTQDTVKEFIDNLTRMKEKFPILQYIKANETTTP